MNGSEGKSSDTPRRAQVVDDQKLLPKSSSSRGPSARKRNEIKILNADDVLLGRGPGLSAFEGNLRFRSLVEERKKEYTGTTRRKEKKMIAEQVRSEIHSRGGRFLQKDDNIDSDEAWYEADEEVAIEKCKQSLREKHTYVSASARSGDEAHSGSLFDPVEPFFTASQSFPAGVQSQRSETQGQGRKRGACADFNAAGGSASIGMVESSPSASATFTSEDSPFPVSGSQKPLNPTAILPQVLACGAPASYVDPRVLLYRSALQQSMALAMAQPSDGLSTMVQTFHPTLGVVQPRANVVSSMPMEGMTSPSASSEYSSASAPMVDDGPSKTSRMKFTNRSFAMMRSRDDLGSSTHTDGMLSSTESEYDDEPSPLVEMPDDTVSESFLSLFKMDAEQPRFTDDDEEKEKASLTDAEKAAALSDMFGKMCTVTPHQAKRSKKDIDNASIRFLIRQMKLEIDKIPAGEKRALLNALPKARQGEFCDARLERFLRCEGMNAELAARRYVNYWSSREALFQDRYLMRMTLGEALADDLDAIEDGVVTLLEQRDYSGRQLVYLQPSRRKDGLYSSESLLKSIWYVMEVASQQNSDISSGFVFVLNHQQTTIFNYDREALDQVLYLERNCWPVQCLAFHVCCPSSICIKILKPLTFVLADKRARSRTIVHDVPETQILGVLEEYGIQNEALPHALGGTYDIDQKSWMANRRAVELEEI